MWLARPGQICVRQQRVRLSTPHTNVRVALSRPNHMICRPPMKHIPSSLSYQSRFYANTTMSTHKLPQLFHKTTQGAQHSRMRRRICTSAKVYQNEYSNNNDAKPPEELQHSDVATDANTPPPLEMYKAALEMCLKEGKYGQLFFVFEDMIENGIVPDTAACNIVAESYLLQGQNLNVHELVTSFMPTNNITPDATTYLILMRAYKALNKPGLVLRALKEVQDKNLPMEASHVTVGAAAALSDFQFEAAREILQQGLDLGIDNEETRSLMQSINEKEERYRQRRQMLADSYSSSTDSSQSATTDNSNPNPVNSPPTEGDGR